jgi:hypothetical protein
MSPGNVPPGELSVTVVKAKDTLEFPLVLFEKL